LQAIFKALKLLPTLPLSPPTAIALLRSSFIASTPLAEVDLPLDEGTLKAFEHTNQLLAAKII
jgi:hypothetical protein